MTTASSSVPIERSDLLQAIAFCQDSFDRWQKKGLLNPSQYRAIADYYADWRARLEGGAPIPPNIHLRPPNVCWSCKEEVDLAGKACRDCGAPVQGNDVTALRYLCFLCLEVRKHQQKGWLYLAGAEDCLAAANSQVRALRSKLDRQRIPLVEAVHEAPVSPAPPIEASQEPVADAIPVQRPQRAVPAPVANAPGSPAPRRNLLEILLDPRSIQWMLASGGALLVVGLLIWLAAMGIFENKLVVAGLMGTANAALLLGGWAVIRFTRHELAGRALTLLACLVMPFNLWFYDRQGLITLSEGGHLWIPAVVCCALYAASARLLRDPTFVYVFVLGVAGTGLLLLADHSVQKFWEIAAPSSLLVALGFLSIHAERVFPEGEGPFSRRRFGLAFFWSGHALLGAGLVLLLGAHVVGDWLYKGLFENVYHDFSKWLGYGDQPPWIVTEFLGRLLSLALVVVGTYLYVYSDLVVRRLGAYLYLAVLTLLWAEVLIIRMFHIQEAAEVAIIALALTGLVANLTLRGAARGLTLLRAGSPLALVLSTLPVVLGIARYWQAGAGELQWTYVAAMLAAAISCRVGAYLYRRENPSLAAIYFFGTGASLLVGAAGLLLVLPLGRHGWEYQAPLLMLIPLLYLGAARLYRGHASERPVLWVAHAGLAVMLVTSIGAAFRGFLLHSEQPLNLLLSLFFAEAAVFYGLEAFWRRHAYSVYATTAAASAAVWQLLKYGGVAEEYYILTFAVVGLALLVVYRFAVLEKSGVGGMASAAYQCGNVLVSLAFVAGAFMTLSELVQQTAGSREGVLITLLLTLAAIALVSLALVRQEGWRRWYVAAAVMEAGLCVLVLAVLSKLTAGERLEIVSVVAGLLLLGAGHAGWYREQEGHNDLVSVTLFFGSVLVALPLTIATIACRYALEFDTFHTLNEVGMLAAALVLLAAGFICQIRSTALAGAFLLAAYLATLLLYVRLPEKLQTTAVYIMVGGGLFFGVGLLLSLYRDRLLQLPQRIKRREGIFRVLTWR